MDRCLHVFTPNSDPTNSMFQHTARLINQATFFQSSVVQFWWAHVNCSLCLLFLADRCATWCDLLLLYPICPKVWCVVCSEMLYCIPWLQQMVAFLLAWSSLVNFLWPLTLTRNFSPENVHLCLSSIYIYLYTYSYIYKPLRWLLGVDISSLPSPYLNSPSCCSGWLIRFLCQKAVEQVYQTKCIYMQFNC